ncbi:phosphodiester glycosidase family protein [Phycicoccus sp. MAQZ13P-2]|nr:phosphodiester glycosidase family protein [Phycicoccus mangrovi]
MVLVMILLLPGISFARAMTYPGNAPMSVRAVEWVRDHGGGPVVDRVETWLYSRNPPPTRGGPQDRLTSIDPAATASGAPAPVRPVLAPITGEGRWAPARSTGSGRVALWTTWFRPDPAHPPVTVAAALAPGAVDRIALGPGTREPSPGAFATPLAQVPASLRPRLVAVFNAGFKMRDTGGGWYLDGREYLPLRDGYASLVIDRDGRARVGAWNVDVSMSPRVLAVRQNLHLVVIGGRPVDGLATNNQGLYGTGRNQFQYTWRSGIGTTPGGDLVYVAGRGLTLDVLARAMAQAGIVTGMELDIHSPMVGFNVFPTPAEATAGSGRRLLTSMTLAPDRYLVPDQRDYFYLTQR